MVGFWIRGAQGVIKGVKALKKFKGQKSKESIIKAGKEKKSKITADERKEALEKNGDF